MLEALLERVRVRRRSRPAPPTAPARSPARSAIDTGKLVKELRARQHDDARRARWRCGWRERWDARRARRARRACAPAAAARRRAPVRGASARRARGGQRRAGARAGRASMPHAGAGRAARDRRARARPPSTCPPASTGSSAARATAPPGPSLPEALVEVSARAGPAGLDPARRRRALLRDAVELEGLRGGHAADGQPHGRRAVALERRRASCRSSSTRARARSGSPRRRRRCSARRTRERHAKLEILDSIAWAHDGCCRSSRSSASSARSPSTRPARAATSGLDARARGDRRASSPTRSSSRRRATCCGFAGDRGLLHPELTAVGDRATRPPSSTAASFDAYVCSATAPARSASQQGTGRPYESFVFALERSLTRYAGCTTPGNRRLRCSPVAAVTSGLRSRPAIERRIWTLQRRPSAIDSFATAIGSLRDRREALAAITATALQQRLATSATRHRPRTTCYADRGQPNPHGRSCDR